MALPILLIGKTVGDVFYKRLSEQVDKKRFAEAKLLYMQATGLLVLLGVIPLIIVLLWAPALFAFVFGDNWAKAGTYAQWLSVWTFFILINAPSLKMIIVLKKQKISLLINAISTPLRVLALLLGGMYFKDEWLTLLLFVVVSILHNVVIILLAYFTCSNKVLALKG